MSSWMVDGHELIGKVKNSKENKINIGQMCQNLIDYARMDYLKNKGNYKNVKLINYVSRHVTKENVLMIATR